MIMAFLLVCVRSKDTILDKAFFSRDLAPVKFDNWEVGLALRHDPCTNTAQYFVIHCRPEKVYVPAQEHDSNAKTGASHGSQCLIHGHEIEQGTRHQSRVGSETSQQNFRESETSLSSNVVSRTNQNDGSYSACVCSETVTESGCRNMKCKVKIIPKCSLVLLDVEQKVVTRLKSDVAYHSFQELISSKKFREGFINYLHIKSRRMSMVGRHCLCDSVYNTCKMAFKIPRLMEVLIEPAPVNISYNWGSKLNTLVKKREALEEAMAQLSTLGGGYSSLGEYSIHFSEEAGKLSLVQLKVAMEMGDPITASKCRLFYALSLMQRGQYVKSGHMIRAEYTFALHLKPRDQKLIDMCKGLWSKRRYLMSLWADRQQSMRNQGVGRPVDAEPELLQTVVVSAVQKEPQGLIQIEEVNDSVDEQEEEVNVTHTGTLETRDMMKEHAVSVH